MTVKSEGYQPTTKLDTTKVPKGGSAVPSQNKCGYGQISSVINIDHVKEIDKKLSVLEGKVKIMEEKIKELKELG